MKFVDSRKDIPFENYWNELKTHELEEGFDAIVEQHMSTIDQLRDIIKGNEESIKQIEMSKGSGKVTNPDDVIREISLLKDFYEANGKLDLIMMDFWTAYKYLIKAETDWEYRFFARRIYTLIHETREGLIKQMGKPFKEIEYVVDEKVYQVYKTKIKNFNKFINDNDEKFKEARNKNDAHKDAPFLEQIDCIERMSVKESMEFIESFKGFLMDLTCSFLLLFPYLNQHVKEVMKSLAE